MGSQLGDREAVESFRGVRDPPAWSGGQGWLRFPRPDGPGRSFVLAWQTLFSLVPGAVAEV